MKYIIVLLSITIAFSTELEVDGNLKVTGNIDAQNNPIKNVGIPQELTDAINGNALQDALRDDTEYEYRMYLTRLHYGSNENRIEYIELQQGVYVNDMDTDWIDHFHDEFFSLVIDGWKIDQTIDYSYKGAYSSNSTSFSKLLVIFKRPLEDE